MPAAREKSLRVWASYARPGEAHLAPLDVKSVFASAHWKFGCVVPPKASKRIRCTSVSHYLLPCPRAKVQDNETSRRYEMPERVVGTLASVRNVWENGERSDRRWRMGTYLSYKQRTCAVDIPTQCALSQLSAKLIALTVVLRLLSAFRSVRVASCSLAPRPNSGLLSKNDRPPASGMVAFTAKEHGDVSTSLYALPQRTANFWRQLQVQQTNLLRTLWQCRWMKD